MLFVLAVLGVVIAVDAVLAGVWIFGIADSRRQRPGPARRPADDDRSVPPMLYLWGAAVTVALILIVSTVNVLRLTDGGEAGRRDGGRAARPPETRDPLERRFLNIVEEMAIASGVRGARRCTSWTARAAINAFAAGYDVSRRGGRGHARARCRRSTATSCRA
mgnify:CR=1 FL=1